jgi:hypothetical protein
VLNAVDLLMLSPLVDASIEKIKKSLKADSGLCKLKKVI